MGDVVRLFPEVDGTRALGARKPCRRGVSASTWLERGLALDGIDAEGAMHAYGRAVAANPRLADGQCNLGRLLHERGQRGDVLAAEGHYRLALCVDAGIALYWFNLGVALEDQGRTAEAIAAYREALAREPALADAHFNLAGLLGRAGDLHSTREAFRHLQRYRALRRAS
jgi:tetratricopeptide (TPR) repeat protein